MGDINGNVLVNSTGNGLDDEQYPDCILPGNLPQEEIKISDEWLYYRETAGIGGKLNMTNTSSPVEMWNITSDTTEYIWYMPTGIDEFVANETYTISFPNVDSFQYGYIYDVTNNVLLAMGDLDQTFRFNANNYTVASERYNIGILVCSMGMDNGGYLQQTNTKGIVGSVLLNGKNINETGWISEGKLFGEYLQLFDESSFDKVVWNKDIDDGVGQALTWWRSSFDTPSDIDMIGAIKGVVYVNGYNLGRYWMISSVCNGQAHSHSDISIKWDVTYCKGLPLQRYYSLPVDWLNPVGQSNDIVIIEEVGMMQPNNIKIVYCESV